MIRFWSICRNTFVQTIRQPIYGVLLLFTFLVLVLSLPMAAWTMGEKGGDYQASDQKMLIQLGLGSLLGTGLLLAAFGASSAVSREIEDRTALTVMSKPVSRATFVLGKFTGVAGAVGAAFYLSSIVFLMTVRHQVMSSAGDPYDWPVIVLGCLAGIIALTLFTATTQGDAFAHLPGWLSFLSLKEFEIPFRVKLACGLTMAAGTAAGGWRIIKTLGSSMVKLQPVHGFAAQTTAAMIIEGASHFGIPLSTTHVISSSIMGVGASKRFKAVKWMVAERMVWAWVMTLPITALISYGLMRLVLLLGGS